MNPESPAEKIENFSLIVGGPIYQFFLRVGILRPPLSRLRWRVLLITMIAWLPLLVLSILHGQSLGGVKIPFLKDFEVHVRLLVALPLLIGAEVILHRRVNVILAQFLHRQIITGPTIARFDQIIDSAMKLRNSTVIELMIIPFVFSVGFFFRAAVALQSDTWVATLTDGGLVRSPAGVWHQLVSVPLFQFLLLRWYFRLFIWIRLLWQVSRLELNLIPTHPDKSCGLGFLDGTVFALAPFLMAHSCLVSGVLANRIIYGGSRLTNYYAEMGMLAVFLILLSLGPLCLFTSRILQVRLQGLHVYGRLASEYVVDFDRKWIRGERDPGEQLVGSADIQSMADMTNVFSVIESVRPFPFGRNSLVGLAAIIALPLLPLVLTMFSLQELLVRLIQIVF